MKCTARYYASHTKTMLPPRKSAKMQQAIGPHKDLLTFIKRHKLKWYGLVSRSSGLAKIILKGTVIGGRRKCRQKKKVERQHQAIDRPGVCQVPEGSGKQGKMEESGCGVICGTPMTPKAKG